MKVYLLKSILSSYESKTRVKFMTNMLKQAQLTNIEVIETSVDKPIEMVIATDYPTALSASKNINIKKIIWSCDGMDLGIDVPDVLLAAKTECILYSTNDELDIIGYCEPYHPIMYFPFANHNNQDISKWFVKECRGVLVHCLHDLDLVTVGHVIRTASAQGVNVYVVNEAPGLDKQVKDLIVSFNLDTVYLLNSSVPDFDDVLNRFVILSNVFVESQPLNYMSMIGRKCLNMGHQVYCTLKSFMNCDGVYHYQGTVHIIGYGTHDYNNLVSVSSSKECSIEDRQRSRDLSIYSWNINMALAATRYLAEYYYNIPWNGDRSILVNHALGDALTTLTHEGKLGFLDNIKKITKKVIITYIGSNKVVEHVFMPFTLINKNIIFKHMSYKNKVYPSDPLPKGSHNNRPKFFDKIYHNTTIENAINNALKKNSKKYIILLADTAGSVGSNDRNIPLDVIEDVIIKHIESRHKDALIVRIGTKQVSLSDDWDHVHMGDPITNDIKHPNILDLMDKTSIHDMLYLGKRCEAIICSHSAPAFMIGLYNKDAIVIAPERIPMHYNRGVYRFRFGERRNYFYMDKDTTQIVDKDDIGHIIRSLDTMTESLTKRNLK